MKRLVLVMAATWLGASVSDASGRTVSQNCKNYVLCFEATGGTKGALDSKYGAMGSCWVTTDLPAQQCDRECMNALTELRAKYPDAGCRPIFVPRASGCG